MKQAELTELQRRIEAVSKASALGARVKHVEVEADEDGEGDPVLRVSLQVEQPESLDWDEVEPLVRSIEESVAAIDERFPSVYFADAA
jgi:hypothetical protein